MSQGTTLKKAKSSYTSINSGKSYLLPLSEYTFLELVPSTNSTSKVSFYYRMTEAMTGMDNHNSNNSGNSTSDSGISSNNKNMIIIIVVCAGGGLLLIILIGFVIYKIVKKKRE